LPFHGTRCFRPCPPPNCHAPYPSLALRPLPTPTAAINTACAIGTEALASLTSEGFRGTMEKEAGPMKEGR